MNKSIGKWGSVSAGVSILGSWQVCHNVCLGLVALLGVLGMTVTGMPLLFLTEWAPYLWSLAVLLLGITAFLVVKKKCISKNILIFNTGLIIAGFPFEVSENSQYLLWVVGGVIAGTAVIAYLIDRQERKKLKEVHNCH